jgi:hypothetical protein
MTGPVFISHSEKDKRISEAFLYALEARGIPCWIAPRDIPPGGSYADAILAAIEDCSCLVLIYTKNSNDSGHVLREVERALKLEKNIVPIRFDESAPSRSLDYLLATVHWLSVIEEPIGSGITGVAARIASSLRNATTKKPQPSLETIAERAPLPPDSPWSPRPRRTVGWISLLVGSIALALIVGLLTRNFRQARPAEINPTPTVTKEVRSPFPSGIAIAPTPTSVLATTASPSPTLPQQPAIAPGSGPIDTLNRYYASFEEREPAVAYKFLSGTFKAKLSYRKFSESFSTTRAMRILESQIVKIAANFATIGVTLEETEADSRRVQWQGAIELVRESEGWRIETMRDLRKVVDAAVNRPGRIPTQSWDRPRIYIHTANDSQRRAAAELKGRLTSSGYVVVGIDKQSSNVDVPTEASELRYFTPADSAEAERIAQELKPILGNVIASLPEGMPYVSHARQYEIWFSQAFR